MKEYEISDYASYVEGKVKPGDKIRQELSIGQAHMLHMCLGFVQEAAELSDVIKKWAIYQKVIEVDNIKEELGDALFFMTAIMTHFEITFKELEKSNRIKLDKRYLEYYSNKEAQDRNDKPVLT